MNYDEFKPSQMIGRKQKKGNDGETFALEDIFAFKDISTFDFVIFFFSKKI